MTGITIEWVNVPVSEKSASIKSAMNEGDMPDIFLKTKMSASNQLKYGEEGKILDLNQDGLLEEYAPNFCDYMDKYPDVRQSQTQPSGAIYSIPAAVDAASTRISRKLFYNQDWLDAVGMGQPTTSEELYDVLKAFKTEDPNGNGIPDEIPLGGDSRILWSTFTGMFGLMNRVYTVRIMILMKKQATFVIFKQPMPIENL